ncbi:MAG: hypothetical protein ACI92Z_001528 [Paracoccaceae bacterium]|jgi:hypothetical protein
MAAYFNNPVSHNHLPTAQEAAEYYRERKIVR